MKLKRIIYVLFTFCLLTSAAYSQINEGVDPDFVPVISKTPSAISGTTVFAKLQPDGKLLVFGDILNGIARYNTDGSLDTSFMCSGCSSINISSVAVQPDGKIIAAGRQQNSNNPRIIRLNADGSLDQTFFNSLASSGQFQGIIKVLDIQADGKIYIRFNQSFLGILAGQVYRLNTNGSIDDSFSLPGDERVLSATELQVLPDGRIFVFGITPYGILAQINADGSKNTSFETPTYTSQNLQSPPISSIGLQSDGKLVIAGEFDSINGIGRRNLARLNANSSLDLDFNPQIPQFLFTSRGQVKVISGDRLLFAQEGSSNQQLLYRINPDGTIDNSYAPPNGYGFFSDVDAQDRAYFVRAESPASKYKITRLNPNGTLDTTYNPVLDTLGEVSVLAVQTDGKIIIAGDFERVNGFSFSGIARINPNGTVDTSFIVSGISADSVRDIVIQADGKILVGGTNGLVRLNSNGSLDASFNPNVSGTVKTIALQSDGKILIGGIFSNVNGMERNSIARLNADGTLDAEFNPVIGGNNPTVNDIISQADGKIVFGGSFTGVNGFNRSNLARLNSDGSLDTNFTSNNSVINIIVRQPDGKYLLATSSGIIRINSNGNEDGRFAPVTNAAQILSLYLQPDGSIVFGGTFSSVNGILKNRIARVFSDGSLDNSFLPSGANAAVRALAAQADGQLIVGGDFSKIGNVTRYALARLTLISVPPRTLFDYDGDGKADISVFRPSNGAWYIQQSTNGFTGVLFGAGTDLIVPADYDGDGKTDVAVFRPSNGSWYRLNSSTGAFFGVQFGQNGDIPIPGDFDGDGKADISVFRPANGTWYRLNSSTGAFYAIQFGQNGDKPLLADFDGDGKNDIAVFRPSNGTFYWLESSTGLFKARAFGLGTDILVLADYDGDGKTDIAVFRPANGAWYRVNSSTGTFVAEFFGQNGDIPVPADYDGDGKANLAVFRPTTNSWYIARPTGTPAQNFDAVQFGLGTDKPTPAAFQQ